jgi:ABC-type molybdenum transport system ATPase subunit/photorepair protein PhrA
MFAGPNGSGKSTLLREILPETLQTDLIPAWFKRAVLDQM